MPRVLRLGSAVICVLCGLTSFYLAATHLSEAGGRSGLLVVGAVFLLIAGRLLKQR